MADRTHPDGAAASSPEALFPYCAHLSSKKVMLTSDLPRTERDVLDASNHCWCNRTSTVMGPDRDLAHPDECRRGRSCFESNFSDRTAT